MNFAENDVSEMGQQNYVTFPHSVLQTGLK